MAEIKDIAAEVAARMTRDEFKLETEPLTDWQITKLINLLITIQRARWARKNNADRT